MKHSGSALILGNWRATLTSARQLSRLGYRVILGSEPGAYYADRSRFVDEIWHSPPLVPPGSNEFRQALLTLLESTPDLRVIMPTRETSLNAVAAMEPELKSRVTLAMPSVRVIKTCHNKGAWLKFLTDAGVDCPPFGTASDLPQLEAIATEIGYPVVVRPSESGKRIGMRKAVTLVSDDDLAAVLPAWPEALSEMLVQQRFRGDRYNSYFAAQEGRLLCEQQCRSLRSDRADGTGQTIEGIAIAPIEALRSDLEKVVAQLNYTGVGNAQFLFDPTSGRSCFLEINPRFGASYAVIEKIGLELTRLAVELAGDATPVTSMRYTFDEGTRFASTFADLAGLGYSLSRREVSLKEAVRWLGSALRAMILADVHVTWSSSDPLPALSVPLWRLRRAFAQGRSVLEP